MATLTYQIQRHRSGIPASIKTNESTGGRITPSGGNIADVYEDTEMVRILSRVDEFYASSQLITGTKRIVRMERL